MNINTLISAKFVRNFAKKKNPVTFNIRSVIVMFNNIYKLNEMIQTFLLHHDNYKSKQNTIHLKYIYL